MTTSVHVRPYQLEDLPQVHWLHDRTPPAGQVAIAPQRWPEELERISDYYLAYWVALELQNSVEAVVGMVGFERAGSEVLAVALPDFLPIRRPTLRLDQMRVAPERQRQGIGRALTQTAIDWARENRYAAIVLDTTPQQEAAMALYSVMGFVERGRSMIGRYELVWFELVL